MSASRSIQIYLSEKSPNNLLRSTVGGLQNSLDEHPLTLYPR